MLSLHFPASFNKFFMQSKMIVHWNINVGHNSIILLTETTAAQNKVALSYHNVRGLYFSGSCFCGTISKSRGK